MSEFFSDTYDEARTTFLRICETRNVEVIQHTNPCDTAPEGTPLVCDVAAVGPAGAPNGILILSGTHGVEGFAGSACLSTALSDGLFTDLAQTKVVLAHALNPFGFAWMRRVNEDNVDVNRNFVEFPTIPTNEDYEKIRHLVIPSSLNAKEIKASQKQLYDFAARHGFGRLQRALVGGQYSDPKGLYFGGLARSWSASLFSTVIRTELARCSRALMVDIHTGLGPLGEAEIITDYDHGSDAHRRAASLCGRDVTSTTSGTSACPVLTGSTNIAFGRLLPDTETTATVFEFGSARGNAVFEATQADHWLHLNGGESNPHFHAVKTQIKDAFWPNDKSWRSSFLQNALSMISHAIAEFEKP